MKNRIERFCEDCQVRLLTKAHHDRCFDKNHNIRVIGQFVLVDSSAKPSPNSIIGIAKEDTKKGELIKLTL